MSISENELKEKHSERNEELLRQLKDKDQALRNYRREHGKLELFFDQLRESISPIEPFNRAIIDTAPGTPIVPVMHITDTHMGMTQHASEIEGFNEYSPEIAIDRGMAFAEKVVNWVEMHRRAYNVREIAIIMTGDLISGDIHDELRITNAYPSPVQVAEAAKLHARQIGLIAPHFDNVTVHFLVEDNHARLTKKPQAKEAGMNSMNYLVGMMLSSHLSGHDNIDMNIYPMLEKVVNVNGRQYLICHGHNVRGWAGVPWYGIERKVGKESQARLQIIMQDVERAKDIGFHKYVFGHFHTPIDLPLYSGGGSMSGTDAYDHQAGRFAAPSQSAWMVHPKYGEFDRVNFVL